MANCCWCVCDFCSALIVSCKSVFHCAYQTGPDMIYLLAGILHAHGRQQISSFSIASRPEHFGTLATAERILNRLESQRTTKRSQESQAGLNVWDLFWKLVLSLCIRSARRQRHLNSHCCATYMPTLDIFLLSSRTQIQKTNTCDSRCCVCVNLAVVSVFPVYFSACWTDVGEVHMHRTGTSQQTNERLLKPQNSLKIGSQAWVGSCARQRRRCTLGRAVKEP